MSSNKICAVVVTFNRCNLLVECLQGLLSQTAPLNSIVIVDNASTDDTINALKAFGPLTEDIPTAALSAPWHASKVSIQNVDIMYIRMHENAGGAGGFHYGVKVAHQMKQFDWLWLMDDDVEPTHDALNSLLRYKEFSQAIHPNRVYEDGTEEQWEQLVSPSTGWSIKLNNLSFKNNKPYYFTNTVCFEGLLFHVDLIEKVGYPDPRFFIVDDDTVYGVQLSQYTNIVCVKDAVFKKKINKNITAKTPFVLYHQMRNFFLRQDYVAQVYGGLWLKYAIGVAFIVYNLVKIPFYSVNRIAYLKAWFSGVKAMLCLRRKKLNERCHYLFRDE